MNVRNGFELVLLGAIWGGSFLFMRTTSPEFGVFPLVALRAGLAALFLLPIVLMVKQGKQVIQRWPAMLFVGLTNTAIPFCLFSYSTVWLGAGLSSILNATAAMFGALVAFLWLKEKLNGFKQWGLVLGFVGVVIVSIERSGGDINWVLWPMLASLLATLCYGIAACFIKKYAHDIHPYALASGSQLFSFLVLIVPATMSLPEQNPSPLIWGQAITLGFVCTGLAYVMYFRLIANIGASNAISVAYLVPVFGVLWGVVFLGESISLPLMAGAVVILLGVAMTTGMIKRKA